MFQKSLLFYIATAARLCVLCFVLIQNYDNLYLRSILQDPTFTLHQVREATAIRSLTNEQRLVDSYHTGSIHLPPLLLACACALLEKISSQLVQQFLLGMTMIYVDYAIAVMLEQIATSLFEHERRNDWEGDLQQNMPELIRPRLSHIFSVDTASTKALLHRQNLPTVLAHAYYASPILVLANDGNCFQSWETFLVLAAIQDASCDQLSVFVSSVCLAVASYWNIHNVLFVIPIFLFLRQRNEKASSQVLWMTAVLFLSLHLLALQFIGSQQYASVFLSTHLHSFRITRWYPSLSLMWYFGMELFDRFQMYFTILLGGLPYLLIAPLTIRLHRYPAVLTAVIWMLGAFFRPPGTLYRWNISFCLALLSPRSLARMQTIPSLVAFCAIPVPLVLYVTLYWMWLESGTGEANFPWMQVLIYNVLVAVLFLQFCSASLQRDKALRLTEKLVASQEHSKID